MVMSHHVYGVWCYGGNNDEPGAGNEVQTFGSHYLKRFYQVMMKFFFLNGLKLDIKQ